MPRHPHSDPSRESSRTDARQLVSAEILGQVKVRRALLRRAVQRFAQIDETSSPGLPDREQSLAEMLALLDSFDQSVATLVELLSLDAPSTTVESRPRGV